MLGVTRVVLELVILRHCHDRLPDHSIKPEVCRALLARFDDPTVIYNRPLILFRRLAWAHDFVSNPTLSAAFEALPGGTFTVNGAPIPHDSALTTAGAQLFLTPSWTLLAKFEGEFAPGSQTYAGTGTLRYTW